MKSRLVFLLLAVQAGGALAQYKCTTAGGAVTFQQTPCFGAGTEEKLDVVPNGHPPAASGAASPAPPTGAASASVDKRMLARYLSQDKRDALVQKLRAAQDAAADRQRQREADVAAARQQIPDEDGGRRLADALSSIDGRYRALSVIDERQVREAQAALDKWDRTQAAANRGK